MTLTKKLGIIAVAFWIAIFLMAYANVWASNMVEISPAQTVHKTKHDRYDYGFHTEWDEQIPAQYADVFPHEQLSLSMWITVAPASLFTAFALIAFLGKEEKQN